MLQDNQAFWCSSRSLHSRLGLGFRNESKGLFVSYANKAVRPDYYLPVSDTGILLEVERGKTTINNMDFLDFWKCHLYEAANYLFLMVARELRQNTTMAPRREMRKYVRGLGQGVPGGGYACTAEDTHELCSLR